MTIWRGKTYFSFLSKSYLKQRCGTYFFYSISISVFKYSHFALLLLRNIWLPCWASLLLEHVLFVQVHAQRDPTPCNCWQHVSASYNCREHVPATYNCREHIPACYNCREHVPASYNCREHVPASYNCREHFSFVTTVGKTFPLL